jgi:hypothetical protein
MRTPQIALALGLGLALAPAAARTAPAATVSTTSTPIQTLETPTMTAAQFNAMFTPVNNAPPLSSPYQFLGAPTSGSINSQVFQGNAGTAAAGLYAYAYQIDVNNVADQTGTPVHVDSMSFQYGATPVGTDLLKLGHNVFAYAIKDGAIGGLTPPAAAPGDVVRVPNTLSYQPGQNIATVRAQYVNPTTQSQPLNAGSNSATFVILSNQPFTQQFVNLQSSLPTTGAFSPVYAATGGKIEPVPIPEPATVLAWAGMAGAVLVVRRVRKARPRAAS